MLDKVIKSYDLTAIHNHSPNDKRFPSPLQVYDAIQRLDHKIGVCMDIGHPKALLTWYNPRSYML